MTYAEKLKSPRWQKKRLEVFERDGFKCRLCSDSETTLHVHHKQYITGREPWEYEDSNFETLCSDCHYLIEAIGEQRNMVRVLKSPVFNVPDLIVMIAFFYSEDAKENMCWLLYFDKKERRLTDLVTIRESKLQEIQSVFNTL